MKFALEWLDDFVDTAAVGGEMAVRRFLEQAGFPAGSVHGSGSSAILDIEITPNRPDAMCHRGLAREIAAMAGLAMKPVSWIEPSSAGPPAGELTSVTIDVPRLCRRFGARVVRGISGRPAPELVRARLAAIGANSISAAVDATNYVLWQIGQPLHAFDLDTLADGRVVVRRAHKGERLRLLDGVEHELEASDVVVADAERAVSLAGIMGGLDTAVSPRTKNVLLEAAWWDPVAIRRTARRLGLHTDASHRFERGADPEAIPEALDRAAKLLLDAAGGMLAPGSIDARGLPWRTRKTALRFSRLRLLAGDDGVALDFAAEALKRLGFTVSRRGRRLRAEIPSWRPDVSIEDDLVEEVLRVYGYGRLPSRLPPARRGGGHLEPLRETEEHLVDVAAAVGLFETTSSPFVDRAREEGPFAAWLTAAGSAADPISVANPLDQTRRDLRSTLMPGLLDAVTRNVHHGERTVAVFEVGRVFDRPGDPNDPPSFESRRFGFALTGDWRAHWSVPSKAKQANFFDTKGLFERLVAFRIAPEQLDWRAFAGDGFAPGAAATAWTAQGDLLGIAGLLSQSERDSRKLPDPVYVGEIRVDSLPPRGGSVRFVPYSPYPPLEADLSFTHARARSWAEIESFVRARNLADLEAVRIVDRYVGPGVPQEGAKTTIRLVFRSAERTLEGEEVNRQVQRLRAELESHLGVTFG